MDSVDGNENIHWNVFWKRGLLEQKKTKKTLFKIHETYLWGVVYC